MELRHEAGGEGFQPVGGEQESDQNSASRFRHSAAFVAVTWGMTEGTFMNHERPAAWPFDKRPVAHFAPIENDPDLAFMLARQATNRLQLDLGMLKDARADGKDGRFVRAEAGIAIGQIDMLKQRIKPFTDFIDQAVRFEAQEMLVVLEGIRDAFESLVEVVEPARPQGAREIAARLLARRA
jgi:hypothetical protein